MTEIPGLDFSAATFEPSGEESDGTPPSRTSPRKRRSDAGQPRGPRSGTSTARKPSAAANKALVEELLDPIAKFAIPMAMVSPTMSAVLVTRGENTAKAMVSIAEKHPKMLAALQRASQIGPATDLAQTVLMMLIGLQMDLGRIPPTHPLAALTGVAALYDELHPSTPDMGMPGGPYSVFEAPPGFGSTPNATDPTHPLFSFTAGVGASHLDRSP